MVIELDAELERMLGEVAGRNGIAPEVLATRLLRKQLFPTRPEPRDEWERQLWSVAIDCGVSLSAEALTSDGIYED